MSDDPTRSDKSQWDQPPQQWDQPAPVYPPAPQQQWAPPPGQPAQGYPPPSAPYPAQGGYPIPSPYAPQIPAGYAPKSKMAAGILGILLGGFGIHNFYLGYTGKAIAQIVVTFFTCGLGSIWGLIEGIMILTGSINTDANGVPLIN